MSKERDPYSRIYWTVMDDEKFDGIREDARLFGSWALLLVLAEMAHPSPAYLPPTVSTAAVKRLVDATLIDLLPGHRYRVHGLAAERQRRSEAARAGGLASGRSRSVERPFNDRSTTVGNPLNEIEPSKAKQSKDEQSTDTARAPDPADVYWSLTGRYPTDKVLGWVDDLTESYGPEAVIRALATTHQADRSTQTLLGRVQDVLRAEARALSLKAQESERQRLKERRAAPREIVDPAAVQEEIQRILRGEAA